MKRNKASSRPPSSEKGKGTVRERTLAHMEDVMRAATTVGAGIVLACGAKAQSAGRPQIVDYVPIPVGCCENPDLLLIRGCLNQQAHWVKSGARWTLQLNLSAHAGPTRVSFEGLKRADVKVTGVSIEDLKVDPRKVEFVLAAGASSRQATMQFPVLCNDHKIALRLVLDISKAPAENGTVPVRLTK